MTTNPSVESLLHEVESARRLARRLMRDESRADDLVQGALLTALESPPRAVRDLGAWMRGVLRNLAREEARSETRRRAREDRSSSERVAARSFEVPAWDLAAQAERHRELIGHVLALDPKYRDVVLMRFYEGLPPREIAARLGMPVDTVRTRYERALRTLRLELDAQYGNRESWCVAFLPLAALVKSKSAVGPAVLVTTAAAAIVAQPIRAFVALAAALLIVLTLLFAPWTRGGAEPRATVATRDDAGARDANDAALDLPSALASTTNGGSPSPADGPADAAGVAGVAGILSVIAGERERVDVLVVDPQGDPVPDLELGWIDGPLFDFYRRVGFQSLGTSRPVVFVGKTVGYASDPPVEYLDRWYGEVFPGMVEMYAQGGASPDWKPSKQYFVMGPEGRAADPFAAVGLGYPSRSVTDGTGYVAIELAATDGDVEDGDVDVERGPFDRRTGTFVSLDPAWCVAVWGERRAVVDDPRSELVPTVVVTPAVVVSGHVVDSSGNPLANARVAAADGDLAAMRLPFVFERLAPQFDALSRVTATRTEDTGRWVTRTLDDGSFRLGPIPARGALFASTGPGTRFRGSARVETPGSSVSDFRIAITDKRAEARRLPTASESRVVRGRVVDLEGDPIEGAVVRFGHEASEETGADGRFELTLRGRRRWTEQEASLPLVASKTGFASGVVENFGARFEDEPFFDPDVVIEMGPALSIAGRVVDVGGRPLEGWHVQLDDPTYLALGALEYTAESVARDPAASIEVETDATGDFVITGLRDRPYALLVWDGKTFVSHVTAPIPASTGDARIVIPSDALRDTFSARVVAPDGTPLPDVEVRIYITLRANSMQANSIRRVLARTDAAGRFTVEGVPLDRVELEFYGVHVMPGAKATLDRSIPDTDHEFVVSRRCRLRLEIDEPSVYIRLLDRNDVELSLCELEHGDEGHATSTWHGGGYLQKGVAHFAVPESAHSIVLSRDIDPDTEIARFSISPDPRREIVLRH